MVWWMESGKAGALPDFIHQTIYQTIPEYGKNTYFTPWNREMYDKQKIM